jgi:hypothetical protein
MNFIHNEVSKVLKYKRITEQTLLELDSRIAIEVYLREKKAAILEDKQIENNENKEEVFNSKLLQV